MITDLVHVHSCHVPERHLPALVCRHQQLEHGDGGTAWKPRGMTSLVCAACCQTGGEAQHEKGVADGRAERVDGADDVLRSICRHVVFVCVDQHSHDACVLLSRV